MLSPKQKQAFNQLFIHLVKQSSFGSSLVVEPTTSITLSKDGMQIDFSNDLKDLIKENYEEVSYFLPLLFGQGNYDFSNNPSITLDQPFNLREFLNDDIIIQCVREYRATIFKDLITLLDNPGKAFAQEFITRMFRAICLQIFNKRQNYEQSVATLITFTRDLRDTPMINLEILQTEMNRYLDALRGASDKDRELVKKYIDSLTPSEKPDRTDIQPFGIR